MQEESSRTHHMKSRTLSYRRVATVSVVLTLVATVIGTAFAIWPRLTWLLGVQDTRVEVSVDFSSERPITLQVDRGLTTLVVPVLVHFDIYNASGSPMSIRDALSVPYESDAYGVVNITPTSIGPSSHARVSADWSFWFFVDRPTPTVMECGEFRFEDRDADDRLMFAGAPSRAFIACLRRHGRDPAVIHNPDNSGPVDRSQSSAAVGQCAEWSAVDDAVFQPEERLLDKLPSTENGAQCDCVRIRSFGESFLFNRDAEDSLQTPLIAIDLTRAYSVGRC